MRARFGNSAVIVTLAVAGVAGVLAGSWSPVRAETTEEFGESHTLAGSYLAGRLARNENDNASAADFYRNALSHDPQNDQLLEQAFLVEAGEGNWPSAMKLAEELVAVQPQHRLAQLTLGLKDFKFGDEKKAAEHFRAASSGAIGELTSALSLAWVKLSANDASAALALLEMPKQAEWAQFYLRYHRALIADIAGRRQDATAAYERAFRQDSRTLRTVLAYTRHAAHAGDQKQARAILKEYLDKTQGEGHPLAGSLREDVEKGGKISLLVSTPSEGLAEVYYVLGEALIGEGAVAAGVLYLQMALYLEPEHPFALAALANAYETNKRYEDAIAIYDRIQKGSPLESAIEIRKAFNLNSLDRVDEARQTLEKLLEARPAAANPPPEPAPEAKAAPAAEADVVVPKVVLRLGARSDAVRQLQKALVGQGYNIGSADGAFGVSTRTAVIAFQKKAGMASDGVVGPATFKAILGGQTAAAAPSVAPTPAPASKGKSGLDVGEELQVLDAMGNILRSRKLYGDAVGYYDRALSLIPKPDRRHWGYYYARGTSYERIKNWPAAEVDLQKALALYPDQPLVLNYLGYSWIDQGRNMKQGMALIEKAVALKPDDGYVVDSLGWAHFKQGNFKESVRYLERAVELKPDDPVLNDHLGDALWKVGREREARFQWEQALSLNPEPEDTEKIKKKLELGLVEAPAASATQTKHASDTEEKKAQ